MTATLRSAGRRLWQTLSSVKTGIILLILVVIVAAAGTVILQRPMTEPDQLQRAYSPQGLRWFDALGLTDVYHAWWFLLLLAAVSVTIVCASIQRFPNAWRYFARPYKIPEEHFRKALPLQQQIPIADWPSGLAAAERVFRRHGLKPERMVGHDPITLYAERNRLSELAVYIVHASLLLIFAGGIVDGLYGYRGFVSLVRGDQKNKVALPDGSQRPLPFAVRCDAAGQENYPDGTPKRWWSKLTVIENGSETRRQVIEVNDPLVYRGVRFYQSSYGPTGEMDQVVLEARPVNGPGAPQEISLGIDESKQLDADTSVRVAQFIPDFVVRDGQVYTRSREVVNPALHLIVESKRTGQAIHLWMPPMEGLAENAQSPYHFEARDLKMGYFTGLQVSHEPGQWAVWAGCLLMGLGLFLAFYLVHARYWAVPVVAARGQLTLWIGAAANKNREVFAGRFRNLVKEIETEVAQELGSRAEVEDVSVVVG